MTVVLIVVRTTEPREDAGEHLAEVLNTVTERTTGGAMELIAWDQEHEPTSRQRAALRVLLGNDNLVERELT